MNGDNVVPLINPKSMEKSFALRLTETEMKTLAITITSIYKLRSKAEHPPPEKTFHLMRIVEKFAKAMESGEHILVEREQLPV